MLGWICLPPYRYWLCLPIPPPHKIGICLYSRMSVCCCRYLDGSGFHPSCSPKKAAAINMWVWICTRHDSDKSSQLTNCLSLGVFRDQRLPIPPPHCTDCELGFEPNTVEMLFDCLPGFIHGLPLLPCVYPFRHRNYCDLW